MSTLIKSATIAAIALAPMSAQAGGLAPAIEETAPVVIIEEPAASPSSASNLIVPLFLLAIVGLAVASGSDSDSDGGAKDIITGD